MADQTYEAARILARKIHSANGILKKQILIIASSDFSHYVHPEEGKRKDDLVIREILNMNTENVYQTVREHHISVCGYGPIMTLMEYAKMLDGEPLAEVIRRGNSGDIIPSSEVVDYITILFSLEKDS
jgi:AmmeMemoRadiSam system protein B